MGSSDNITTLGFFCSSLGRGKSLIQDDYFRNYLSDQAMGDNEQKALQLVNEAENKLETNSNATEEAFEMLGRAANMFKMAKKWSQVGKTLTILANHHLKVIRETAMQIFKLTYLLGGF